MVYLPKRGTRPTPFHAMRSALAIPPLGSLSSGTRNPDLLVSVAAALMFSRAVVSSAGLAYKDLDHLVRRAIDELTQIAKWSQEEEKRITATAEHLEMVMPMWRQ